MAFGLTAYVSRDGYPRNRARLASRCWSGSPGQAFTRRAPLRGFQLTSCLLSSSPKPLGTWHNPRNSPNVSPDFRDFLLLDSPDSRTCSSRGVQHRIALFIAWLIPAYTPRS